MDLSRNREEGGIQQLTWSGVADPLPPFSWGRGRERVWCIVAITGGILRSSCYVITCMPFERARVSLRTSSRSKMASMQGRKKMFSGGGADVCVLIRARGKFLADHAHFP